MYLGIDVGGTHTDAVLCNQGQIYATSKVKTISSDLALSIKNVLLALQKSEFHNIKRITLGTTLGLNALIEQNTKPVGLFLTAGSGMDPLRFTQGLGQYVYRVQGGLDHRGNEVIPLNLQNITKQATSCIKNGVKHFAIAGKFSIHNPEHEQVIAEKLCKIKGINAQNITLSHTLSGALNFPRRMLAAYINASIQDMQRNFLLAVKKTLEEFSFNAPIYLLKADGGAVSWEYAYAYPIYSVLSGPAASVMGGMALHTLNYDLGSLEEDAFILDMGGTTTDLAIYAKSLPILDREGMRLPIGENLHITPMRSLATVSLGLGGDSPLEIVQEGNEKKICIKSSRYGDAIALGGNVPTLLDALNVCAMQNSLQGVGNIQASQMALEVLAKNMSIKLNNLTTIIIEQACKMVADGLEQLLQRLMGYPVYTLAELLEDYSLNPQKAIFVGAPAKLFAYWLEPYLWKRSKIKVYVPPHNAVVNALGAALTLPTAHLELFAHNKKWSIPVLNLQGTIDKKFTIQDGIDLVTKALHEHFPRDNMHLQNQEDIDVVLAQSFATLDENGLGGKDVRVVCQYRPGILTKHP